MPITATSSLTQNSYPFFSDAINKNIWTKQILIFSLQRNNDRHTFAKRQISQCSRNEWIQYFRIPQKHISPDRVADHSYSRIDVHSTRISSNRKTPSTPRMFPEKNIRIDPTRSLRVRTLARMCRSRWNFKWWPIAFADLRRYIIHRTGRVYELCIFSAIWVAEWWDGT